MNLDDTLARLAVNPAAPTDLAAAALELAADEYPDLDRAAYLDCLDSLADGVRPRLRGDLAERVESLSQFLYHDERFTGNAGGYYQPQNSYLNDVLDRRLGIPITLSLVAVEVGKRVGLEIVGVGLPGHFVAKAIDGPDEVLFDPFHGGDRLTPDACAHLVEAVAGVQFEPTPESLAATAPAAVLTRMLTNLKAIYCQGGDFARAARVVRRLTQLHPNDLLQQRDFGILLARSGDLGRAIAPLERYLAEDPCGADVAVVLDCLRTARKTVATWN